ncbi:hypothetical protein Lal_00034214 [Lupinus albus]|nr:hypothetical protein Lal_00034214 [Lupinus albus]
MRVLATWSLGFDAAINKIDYCPHSPLIGGIQTHISLHFNLSTQPPQPLTKAHAVIKRSFTRLGSIFFIRFRSFN